MPTSTEQEPGPDMCITLIVQDGALILTPKPFLYTAAKSKVELQESTEKHNPETHGLTSQIQRQMQITRNEK